MDRKDLQFREPSITDLTNEEEMIAEQILRRIVDENQFIELRKDFVISPDDLMALQELGIQVSPEYRRKSEFDSPGLYEELGRLQRWKSYELAAGTPEGRKQLDDLLKRQREAVATQGQAIAKKIAMLGRKLANMHRDLEESQRRKEQAEVALEKLRKLGRYRLSVSRQDQASVLAI